MHNAPQTNYMSSKTNEARVLDAGTVSFCRDYLISLFGRPTGYKMNKKKIMANK